eukprot:gnl/Ergobibamus_cyprinoides/4276.p1 GENE.gnl/Ergobibamus_cyprinoides/4276~~gnl/Ergobibamus_cyprinoides/4276.p1  ORF type:complete len:135 (-),score=16.87 gnl/Ergobibamus_cyprinoides/4276:146-550(-)
MTLAVTLTRLPFPPLSAAPALILGALDAGCDLPRPSPGVFNAARIQARRTLRKLFPAFHRPPTVDYVRLREQRLAGSHFGELRPGVAEAARETLARQRATLPPPSRKPKPGYGPDEANGLLECGICLSTIYTGD